MQTMGDLFSTKGTNLDKGSPTKNVMHLYSQLSTLLLKKEGKFAQQNGTPKAQKMNKSLKLRP